MPVEPASKWYKKIMVLDANLCFRAVQSRDPRFDGRFFTGVLTTRIYCRPVCPAPTPKARNIRYFPCAAAAEEAGFRPCLRCRPEASPGTPAWTGTSATVSRALRLIQDGELDGESVGNLAGRLGIGDRHLRRLFEKHLGASPQSIARSRRVHFARRLIRETPLSMTRVAEAAGFTSIRQFNHAIRKSVGAPPTWLRRAKVRKALRENPDILPLRLGFRPPLEWDSLGRFLQARAIPGVELLDGNSYRRTVPTPAGGDVIEVRPVPGENHLLLRVPVSLAPDLFRIVERVRRLFDLDSDPLRIGEHLIKDPRLAPSVRSRPGIRVPGAWDGFELAVRAILGQQVTVRGATTLAGRLVRSFGTPLNRSSGDRLTHGFPGPAILAEADLSRLGVPRIRSAAIRELALRMAAGDLRLDPATTPEEVVARLTEIRGIGKWTAHYIAMRALGEPDAFPATDLGLLRAGSGSSAPLTETELLRCAERWRPWRAYAAMYLWTALAENPNHRRSSHGNRNRRNPVSRRQPRPGASERGPLRIGVRGSVGQNP